MFQNPGQHFSFHTAYISYLSLPLSLLPWRPLVAGSSELKTGLPHHVRISPGDPDWLLHRQELHGVSSSHHPTDKWLCRSPIHIFQIAS